MGHLFRPAIGTHIGFSHSVSSFVIVGAPNCDARAVAWSPTLGLFCAVGGGVPPGTNNGAMTSPDGLIWTQQVTPAGGFWRGIVWADALGLFVAVGGGAPDRVMTSPDGVNWTPQVAAAANDWQSVAWSPELGLLVAVSNNGVATQNTMTSVDGVNWVMQVDVSDGGVILWVDIAWAPELTTFVAISNGGGLGPGGGLERVQSSINGVNWFRREIPGLPGNPNLNGVAWSPKLGLFAAVDLGNASTDCIRTSPDGISWTARNTPLANAGGAQRGRITWSPEQEMFVAVTGSYPIAKRVLTSIDGINWFVNVSNINTGTDNNWSAIAWSPALDLFAMVAVSAASTDFAGTLVAP